jgi:hypothetical protein
MVGRGARPRPLTMAAAAPGRSALWARKTWARKTWARKTWARKTWARKTWARKTWARRLTSFAASFTGSR